MKEVIRYGIILSLICVVAGASLAAVNSVTKNKISAQIKLEEEAGLKEVMPRAEKFEPVIRGTELIYYKAYGLDNKFIGVVFLAQGKGYSSDIQIVAGMLEDGTLTAIKILNQNETPGLGSRVTEENFLQQFSRKNSQNLDNVQAITGATISSKAVIDSVQRKAGLIKELIKDAK